MFIKLNVGTPDSEEQTTEIIGFNGIRRVNGTDMVVIETSHVNHDYFISCSQREYELLIEELEYVLKKQRLVNLIALTGGPVLRVRKGVMSMMQAANEDQAYYYHISEPES